jgi:hypothetical protein
MFKYQVYNDMNSPLPISVLQRGVEYFTPPSFACRRIPLAGSMKSTGHWDEYMKKVELYCTIIIHSRQSFLLIKWFNPPFRFCQSGVSGEPGGSGLRRFPVYNVFQAL